MVSSDFSPTVSVACHWNKSIITSVVFALAEALWSISSYCRQDLFPTFFPFFLHLLAEVHGKVQVHKRIQAANTTFLCRYGKILPFMFSAPFLIISNTVFWLIQEFWNSPEILTIQYLTIQLFSIPQSLYSDWWQSAQTTSTYIWQILSLFLRLLFHMYHFIFLKFNLVLYLAPRYSVCKFLLQCFIVSKFLGVLRKGKFPVSTFTSLFVLFLDYLGNLGFTNLSIDPWKSPRESNL